MRTFPRSGLLCLLLLPGAAFPARAEPPEKTKDAEALAARLDQLLSARWDAAKVKPAAAADDAEFMRRLYLDLAGTIPPVSEVRAFLADKAPDKRRRLIDRLLDGPDYVNHFTNVWRATWLPDGGAEVDNFGLRGGFEAWLRVRLRQNAGYDRMVREIITAVPVAEGRGETSLGESVFAVPTAGAPFRRPRFTSPTKTSRRSWPAARRASSSACGWSAPSATITPSRSGPANNSGSTPPSSPERPGRQCCVHHHPEYG